MIKKRWMKNIVQACMFSIICLVSANSFAKSIMILGDSLSAGYGMQLSQGWVSLLQKRLDQQYAKKHQVINASVSGESTSGALARLPKLLSTHRPDIVVIELGGNDGLRGQPPQMIENNLSQIIQQSQKANASVLILGMRIPPNYGTAYSTAFENSFKRVSQRHKIKLVPFFMQGVAGNKNLMQKDLIHPNASAQRILLDNAYPAIIAAL